MIEIKCTDAPIFAASMSRCFMNISRVGDLLTTFKEHENDDILRLAVVFLHSTIEDCMRNIIYFYIVENPSEEILNEIPLFEFSNSGRPEKFHLGHLLKFKDELIWNVVERSVLEFVNRQTFNSSTDIVKWLKKTKIDHKKTVSFLSVIDNLIKRRHNIVHNSDFEVNRSVLNSNAVTLLTSENSSLASISFEQVEEWFQNTNQFCIKILQLALPVGASISLRNVQN